MVLLWLRGLSLVAPQPRIVVGKGRLQLLLVVDVGLHTVVFALTANLLVRFLILFKEEPSLLRLEFSLLFVSLLFLLQLLYCTLYHLAIFLGDGSSHLGQWHNSLPLIVWLVAETVDFLAQFNRTLERNPDALQLSGNFSGVVGLQMLVRLPQVQTIFSLVSRRTLEVFNLLESRPFLFHAPPEIRLVEHFDLALLQEDHRFSFLNEEAFFHDVTEKLKVDD